MRAHFRGIVETVMNRGRFGERGELAGLYDAGDDFFLLPF